METKAKLEEVFDILSAMLGKGRPSSLLCRAHRLVESAIRDFFHNEDDVADIPEEGSVYIDPKRPSTGV
jgi:hypothetical protein